jgi:ribonuclease Z
MVEKKIIMNSSLLTDLFFFFLVSATLIKIPAFGSVLLDAGEGTYGQMLRHFGRDRIAEEMDDLRCIFVSHLHADHHLGVFQLLLKRNKVGLRKTVKNGEGWGRL